MNTKDAEGLFNNRIKLLKSLGIEQFNTIRLSGYFDCSETNSNTFINKGIKRGLIKKICKGILNLIVITVNIVQTNQKQMSSVLLLLKRKIGTKPEESLFYKAI